MNTFAKLKITCCNQTVLKKMDILGDKYDELLQEAKQQKGHTHPGFVIPFDNVDIRLECRNMTSTSQNKDNHWVNHCYVENRVSGNLLCCDTIGNKEILELEICSFYQIWQINRGRGLIMWFLCHVF